MLELQVMKTEGKHSRFGPDIQPPLITAPGLNGKIQQHQEIPPSEKIKNFKGKVIYGAINAINSRILRPGVEHIMVKIDVEYAPDFGDKYIKGIQNGYHRPLVAANHRRIVDGLFPGDTARDLVNVGNEFLPQDQQLRGFALALAASLHYGYQGPMRKAFYDGLLPVLEDKEMNPFLVVRRQDVGRYQMEEYFDPRQEQDDSIRVIRDGFGIFILPEGTTVGNEMNQFMPTALFTAIDTIEKAGEKALLIPMSITGGDKIQHNNKLPTLMSFKSGFWINNDHFIKIYVGAPMKYDKGKLGELYKSGNRTGINHLVGGLIAAHLPENERGVYAELAKSV